MLEIRAHHGMCLFYFAGNGYSREFTEYMTEIKQLTAKTNPVVKIVAHTDHICSHCPNNLANKCSSFDKVESYDRAVLEYCGLEDGTELPFSEFQNLVIRNIIQSGCRKKICGDCQWNSLC